MRRRETVKVASHIPLLVRVYTISEGDVLELGTGYFSTLVLRWLSEMSGRNLYSYENRGHWYNRAIQKPKPFHKVFYTPNYDDADIERHWGMVFIDHGPNARRIVEIERLASFADYMVIHDTSSKDDKEYHYSKIWHLFKYRYDFDLYYPPTSVVSNLKDLTKINW
jgi:hypothetical protein